MTANDSKNAFLKKLKAVVHSKNNITFAKEMGNSSHWPLLPTHKNHI